MSLPTSQVDRFYGIWFPLLKFSNEQLKVVPGLSGEGPEGSIDRALATQVRDALWDHEEVLDRFISENPAQLAAEDLAIAKSWKYRRKGPFIIFKALKKHAIFISQDNSGDVFAVKSLYNTFDEIFGPLLPVMVETVLLPYNDDIVADGLFQAYNVYFGSGIRGALKAGYDDAKERGEIITSLLPSREPLSWVSQVAKAEATNKKTFNAFQKHQFQSGYSPKTVERDLTHVASFAQYLKAGQQEPVSLRDFESEALEGFLLSLPEKGRKAAQLSLKRFVSFLRDTARLEWDDAEWMLEVL